MSNIQFFDFREYTPLNNSIRTADELSTKLPVTYLNISPLCGVDSNIHRYKSMPYIPYDNCQRSPMQYVPIQHIRMNSIQGYPHTRPQSIHPYTNIIDNPYLIHQPIKHKLKRNVSWKNENLVGFTFSKDEYDRTIDSLQIRKNIEEIRQYHLAKMQPLTRQPSVGEDLFELDLEQGGV